MAWKRLFASNSGVDFGFASPGGRHWLRLVNHILKGEETYADTTNELTLMTSPPFTAGGSALVLNSLSFRT